MRLKKFPVYVQGKEYRIKLKAHHAVNWRDHNYWIAKFYKPKKHIRCFDTYIRAYEFKNTDYVALAKEAVKRFEEELNRVKEDKFKLQRFEEWDGK